MKTTDQLVETYRMDPGSPYSMTEEELQRLLGAVGEEEPVVDAVLKLGGASKETRARAIGANPEDFGDCEGF